ncbi:DNA gyrase inhibitor YacG [Microbulbifer discodermiae]|uniref:DNA gyrase inhibitor YacG n=1 Tax=Microbulbifer sp. 2201CG32-9 TaxID=3232309 RepID=UPI00345BA160
MPQDTSDPTPTLPCPSCKRPITWSADYPHRPFCSERCQLMDLGDWASESHRIPGQPVYDDLLSGDLDLTQH